jgi:hypothetical protein
MATLKRGLIMYRFALGFFAFLTLSMPARAISITSSGEYQVTGDVSSSPIYIEFTIGGTAPSFDPYTSNPNNLEIATLAASITAIGGNTLAIVPVPNTSVTNIANISLTESNCPGCGVEDYGKNAMVEIAFNDPATLINISLLEGGFPGGVPVITAMIFGNGSISEVAATPIPASWSLLLTALIGLFCLGFFSRKSGSAIALRCRERSTEDPAGGAVIENARNYFVSVNIQDRKRVLPACGVL